MYYDKHTRCFKVTLKPIKVGNSLAFIIPKTAYLLQKKSVYEIDIKITNLTEEFKEGKKNGTGIRY
jgi:hypothetical protein